MITLNPDEAQRLAALAAHEGETPESMAARALRERLDHDAGWEADVRAAIAEIESGDYLTEDGFNAKLDTLLAEIAPQAQPR